ncbi:MAG: type II toxin-antitoxin system VapC family toxin [Nitrospiraceae bacterium]|nr:type II toxin-antitoxin system VapC family toxin [Nitrospiraceae bacterium]
MIYFDTSALAKKYLKKEKGRNKVLELLESNPQRLASSALTHLEVISALTRRQMEISGFEKAIAAFNDDWETFIVWAVDSEVLDDAASLIRLHRLKAADAVHLATARNIRHHTKDEILIASSDHELLAAAGREGLPVMDPEVD